jgi:hypothetical protein
VDPGPFSICWGCEVSNIAGNGLSLRETYLSRNVASVRGNIVFNSRVKLRHLLEFSAILNPQSKAKYLFMLQMLKSRISSKLTKPLWI